MREHERPPPPAIVARMAATVSRRVCPTRAHRRRSTISTSGHARFEGRMTSGPAAGPREKAWGPMNATEKPSTRALVDMTSLT